MRQVPSDGDYVVGLNQTLRLLSYDAVKCVYLAYDADERFQNTVVSAVKKSSCAELDKRFSSSELAKKYGIEVPVGVVAVCSGKWNKVK